MDRKKLQKLVLSVFITVSVIGVVLFVYLNRNDIVTEVEIDTEVELIPQAPDATIMKASPGDGIIFYDIVGSFPGGLEKRGNFLYGELRIKDDLLNREIPIYIGSIDQTTNLGQYSEDFNSDSNWKKVPISEVLEEIKAGEAVVVRIEYELDGSESDVGVRSIENVLDSMIKEHNSENYETEIPDDFFVNAVRIGVVR